VNAPPVNLYAGAVKLVTVAGQSIVAAYGPLLGGLLQNPFNASDQGLAASEVLYVDITGPASAFETATTQAIQPGGIFTIPANLQTNVWVAAQTAGHKFSVVVYQASPAPLEPQTGTFPPSGPTTLTELVPSYLYEQYQDDDDLQAFVGSWNSLAQGYVDWFAETYLGDYTSDAISGPLLDWIAEGIYGMSRPTLSSGANRDIGPLNTYEPNVLEPNQLKRIGPTNVTATTDDIFKRIMTWNFYKGDGNVFNIRWLKRRILRFLIGVNGTAPNIDQTYPVSVSYSFGIIVIRITAGTRALIGGALPNFFACNTQTPNGFQTSFTPSPSTHFPLEPVLKEALESGFLQMPFQYAVAVAI
jgi:hypothetical protein